MAQMSRKALYLISFISLLCSGQAMANSCGSLENRYGPYDYTNPVHFTKKLPVVEQYHFSASVERLAEDTGLDSGGVENNLDYVLRAFPNHHRALASMARYMRSPRYNPYKTKFKYTAECYFERAFRVQPKDIVARNILAIHLQKTGRPKEAEQQYLKALEINSNYYEANYNLGLLYFSQKRYQDSLAQAKIAYDNNYPLPGLKAKLKKAGIWKD